MELTDKLKAKANLFFVAMELANRRDRIEKDRPERRELIDDLNNMCGLVSEALEVFQQLDKDNDELNRLNFAKSTEILKLEREIRDLNNALDSFKAEL